MQNRPTIFKICTKCYHLPFFIACVDLTGHSKKALKVSCPTLFYPDTQIRSLSLQLITDELGSPGKDQGSTESVDAAYQVLCVCVCVGREADCVCPSLQCLRGEKSYPAVQR